MNIRPGLLISAIALCLAATASGQGQLRDFQLAKNCCLPLSSHNAAVISFLGSERFSEMHAGFTKENGGLIPLEASPDSWTANAGTESFIRFSDKLAFKGSLSYSCFRGQEMGGQILMEPSRNPINFLEEDLNTVGTKKRKTYSLGGALAWSFNDRLAAGLAFDYNAADQTKYKDPRFLNVLMDFTIDGGAIFRLSDKLSVGADLFWNHRQEQLSAGLYGTVDREYDVLVDQGGFFGTNEDFIGDLGYVSLSNARPMAENKPGFALQLMSFGKIRSFNQLTAAYKSGHFGSKTSSSVVFCEFDGPEVSYKGILSIPAASGQHRISLDASFRNLANNTNSYKYVTQTGMNTQIVYTGQNRTLDRTEADAKLAWELHKNCDGFRPDWIFAAWAEGYFRSQRTTIYPSYRDQDLARAALFLKAERNIKKASDCFSLSAEIHAAAGSGNPRNDGSYGGGSSKVKSFDAWLDRQFEYETAPRAGASLNFTWTILSIKGYAPYLSISDSFTSLVEENEYLGGRSRNVASIVIGCNF